MLYNNDPGGFLLLGLDEGAYICGTELFAGRYVLSSSLAKEEASVGNIVRHYRALQRVERRFRVMKDFLGLRPIDHFTEEQVRGHIALCVLAAMIDAVMGKDLTAARVMHPDLEHQVLSPRRALDELDRIRLVAMRANSRSIRVVTRRKALRSKILTAFGVNTSSWDKADIT